jgi:hypothetical protein
MDQGSFFSTRLGVQPFSLLGEESCRPKGASLQCDLIFPESGLPPADVRWQPTSFVSFRVPRSNRAFVRGLSWPEFHDFELVAREVDVLSATISSEEARMRWRNLVFASVVAAVSVGCAVAEVSAQTTPPPPPVHTAREVILNPAQSEVEVPLAFSGFDPSTVSEVRLFNAANQQLTAEAGARVKEIIVANSGPYAGQRVVVLYTDINKLAPQKLVLELRSPSSVMAFIHVPFVAPQPQVDSVKFDHEGTAATSLLVTPGKRRTTRVRIFGGPFLTGTKLELPKPFEVGDPVVTTDLVTATVVQTDRPSYEIPIGPVLLSIANTRGGESQQVPINVQGEKAPQVLELSSGIAVSGESRESFTLTVNNIADSARVEIQKVEGIDFADIALPLGDLTGETVTLTTDLPPLLTNHVSGSVRVRVVNRDNTVGEQVVPVRSAPRPTLKVTGAEKLTLSVPTPVAFEPQNSPAALFTGPPGAYTLTINDQDVKLQDVGFDIQRTVMRATVNVPETHGSQSADEVTRTVVLHGPGLPGGALQGLVTLVGIPVIESPTIVPLRPGEIRAVPIRGRRSDVWPRDGNGYSAGDTHGAGGDYRTGRRLPGIIQCWPDGPGSLLAALYRPRPDSEVSGGQ